MDSTKLLQRMNLWKNAQLILFLFFQISFILLIVCNANFRYNVFANKSLFFICLLMWISSLTGIIFLIHDYSSLKHLLIEQHALSKIAYLDDLTGIPNRYSCDLFLKNFSNTNNFASLGCGMITISNLKQINAEQDRECGDEIIQIFSNILDDVSKDYGFVGRNGGNEFIIIIENCMFASDMDSFFETLSSRLDAYNKASTKLSIQIEYTYLLNKDVHKENLSELLTLVHNKLSTINTV